jgi:hypothetical protein
MSVWFATILAKAYQYKAEFDPFHPGWIRDCEKDLLLLASELCECDFVGYRASLLSTDESRLAASHEFGYVLPD